MSAAESPLAFGPYRIEVEGDEPLRHVTIRSADGQRPEPNWYEMQYMKCMALGAQAFAVEVFPASRDVVDGAHQRHLWEADERVAALFNMRADFCL